MPGSVKIFISYSHIDTGDMERLVGHLKSRQRLNNFELWTDKNIEGGDEWLKKITMELNTAHIILMLISTNFIQSPFCYEKEMKLAMELHNNGRATVIPVMLMPCKIKGHAFDILQSIPDNPRTISEWDNADRACISIINNIELKIDILQKRLDNTDIDWRKKDLEDMLAEGNLVQGSKKLLDFCTDFSDDRIKFRARNLIQAYNSLVLEKRDTLRERMNFLEMVYDLVSQIRFSPLPKVA